MKRLNLVFLNQQGKSVTLTLNDPVEPADPAAIKAAMAEIVTQNVFISTGGELTQAKSARISENITTPISIA
ncbi:DUF2922 domain-containing protein [Sporolactobacillus putidus]|uniref:DUF2922 domain-containing protein n=1 Tax=Sporolactobacillus putidus TaxID=492735 RepID=A0A917S6L4_9BACL|nr:DUF2922 domain-containing protein [Sporolactobacillus putidus]GGL58404.1 hypothetical protein GCM10007968_23030 [Sporolactobacillus putidus]